MTKVQFYSGSTVPTTTNLPEGGIYFNTDNKNIYVRKNDNTIHNFNIGDKVESSGSVDSATKANCLVSQNQLTSMEAIDNFLVGGEVRYATFRTDEIASLDFGSNDGMLLSIPWQVENNYGVQLAFDDNPAGNIAFRGKSTNWGLWHKFIHSGNISSQSVNYANSAGTASTASTATNAINAANDEDGQSIKGNYVKQSITLANGTDLNTVVTSGFYRLTENHVNGPKEANGLDVGIQYGQLIVSQGADTITQIVFAYYSSRMFIRCGNPSNTGGSGSWTDWEEVITSGNISSQSVDSAANDGNGNSIADTYATKDDLNNAIASAITNALKASY